MATLDYGQILERNEKEVARLIAEMLREIKMRGGHYAEYWSCTSSSDDGSINHRIGIENNIEFSADMRYIVSKSKFATPTSHQNIRGHYVWDIDTYLKELSIVDFRF